MALGSECVKRHEIEGWDLYDGCKVSYLVGKNTIKKGSVWKFCNSRGCIGACAPVTHVSPTHDITLPRSTSNNNNSHNDIKDDNDDNLSWLSIVRIGNPERAQTKLNLSWKIHKIKT